MFQFEAFIQSHKEPYNLIDGSTLNKENEISILWPFCKKTYYIQLKIVETMLIAKLVRQVTFQNKIYGIKLNTKAKAIELMKSSGKDSASYEYILLCSITQRKMKLPARSLHCSHLKCFDMCKFLFANKVKPSWICPVCKDTRSIRELGNRFIYFGYYQ
jgi:E3 SUMO-protein ligase PIAS1